MPGFEVFSRKQHFTAVREARLLRLLVNYREAGSNPSMANIGLVVREDIQGVQASTEALLAWVHTHGHSLCIEQHCGLLAQSNFARRLDLSQIVQEADLIVVLGGDGTFIRVARLSESKAPIILGVNFGTLGFLTEVQPDELLNLLPMIFDGRARIGERSMLRVSVFRGKKKVFQGPALNDAVVHKGSKDRLLDLEIALHGKALTSVRADGLIISTPTGSTAYSLAAGGSIVYPSLDAMLITPLCPHSLTSRPFIIPMKFPLDILLPHFSGSVDITLDGQESFTLHPGDRVAIEQHEFLMRFVESPSKGYFEILREKLNWGRPNLGAE